MIGADAVLPEEPDEASRLKKPRSRKGRAVIDADDSGWDGMPNAAGWLSSVAGLLAWSAGEAGLDERDAVRVSGVAVRAANRNDRLSLWTGTIRRQARTLGGWMLACVFLIMASGWPPSAWALVWFLMNLGLITFLLVDLWPICLALALRQRGTGRFLLPAALTFAGWGLTLAARALLQANSPIPGLATGPRWVVVFLLTFTLILATIAWRLGLRHGFIVRASDPKLLPKSFLNLSMDRAWAITFFYLLLGPSGIGLTLFVMVLHAIR
jgi:hypothetical protein